MKKICFVATQASSLRTFLLKTAEALFDTGSFEIYFMASPNEKIEKEFPEYIHFIPVHMKRGIDKNFLKNIKKMKTIFKREEFDIVQYFTPNASCCASIAAKQAKIPVRLYTQWGLVYIGFSGLKKWIFKRIEKFVCANSTYIEVENRANLEFSHQEKLYPQNVGSVVWNGSACGVSLEKYNIEKKNEWRKLHREELGIRDGDFVFGFCGRQNKDKGLNELFLATKKMLEENTRIHLILMGSSGDSVTLNQDLYRWAKNCPNIHFIGRVSNPEEYYSVMDCYTMPSYREGFGMTIIEAQSMGVPVVISDIIGHKDTMIPNITGIVVKPKDEFNLYQAMKNMVENDDMRTAMGNKGRSYVEENFEQKQLMQKIVEVRKQLVFC